MSLIQKRKSNCYCINLRRAANIVSNIYDSFLAPIDLTVNQFSLLTNLKRLGSGSVSDLANYVGLERTTIVRMIKPLIECGLIMDSADAGQRNRCLELTELGIEKVNQGQPLWEGAQEEIRHRIGADRVKAFYETLAELNEW